MVAYTLYYFPFRARGEPIRYIFHQAGVDFEDKRVDFSEWADIKEKLSPTGHMPLLFEDGKPLANSTSVGMYLAKKFDLAGKDDFEQAKTDMIACYYEGIFSGLIVEHGAILRAGEVEKAAEFWESKKKTLLADHFKHIDKLLADNGGTWLVGNSVTYADFAVANVHALILEFRDKKALEGYPRLQAHCDRVHQLPNIKNYIAKRPQTPF